MLYLKYELVLIADNLYFLVWKFSDCDGSLLFVLLRGGKQVDSVNGTLPSYQKTQEEEPQKKLPGINFTLLINLF